MKWIKDRLPPSNNGEDCCNPYYLIKPKGYESCMAMYIDNAWWTSYFEKVMVPIEGWYDINNVLPKRKVFALNGKEIIYESIQQYNKLFVFADLTFEQYFWLGVGEVTIGTTDKALEVYTVTKERAITADEIKRYIGNDWYAEDI